MYRSIADLSTGGSFTGDWYLDMWVRFQWSWLDLLCCMYLARATINCNRLVTKISSTSTILVESWRISAATTTLTWLRCCVEIVQFDPVMLVICYHCIHRTWMFSSQGELTRITFSFRYLSFICRLLVAFSWLIPHQLWWGSSLCRSLFKEAQFNDKTDYDYEIWKLFAFVLLLISWIE